MSLPIEQLLMPRYMVIADYPNALLDLEIGVIIEGGNARILCNDSYMYDLSEYPAIFRPMPWYEGRKVEDMPGYLIRKHATDKTVFKAEKHFVSAAHGDGFLTTDYTAKSYCNYLPATAEEYISHINKTK